MAADLPAARHPPLAASTPPVIAPDAMGLMGSSFCRIAISVQSNVEKSPPHMAKPPAARSASGSSTACGGAGFAEAHRRGRGPAPGWPPWHAATCTPSARCARRAPRARGTPRSRPSRTRRRHLRTTTAQQRLSAERERESGSGSGAGAAEAGRTVDDPVRARLALRVRPVGHGRRVLLQLPRAAPAAARRQRRAASEQAASEQAAWSRKRGSSPRSAPSSSACAHVSVGLHDQRAGFVAQSTLLRAQARAPARSSVALPRPSREHEVEPETDHR